jgi:hypothetical protein
MNAIIQRVNRAAQSILENENLTADLNDEAAQVLLDWGIAQAKAITMETVEIGDDEEAAEFVYPKMKALRRMLRTVNKWYAKVKSFDKDYGTSALERILEQAAVIYGEEFIPPTSEQQAEIINQQSNLQKFPAAFIAELQSLIENPPQDV